MAAILFLLCIFFVLFWVCRRNNSNEKNAENSHPDLSDVMAHMQPTATDHVPPQSNEPVTIVLDVETTGLDPKKDAIVQVTALRFGGNQAIDGMSTYANPHRPIPPQATAINRITDDMVQDAPDILEIKDQFMNFIEGAVLVGHNVPFDLAFLDQAFHGALNGAKYVDTLELSRALLSLPNYRLETVASHLGFQPEGNYHDSKTDCSATAAVYFGLGLDKHPEFVQRYQAHCRRPRATLLRTSAGDSGDAADAIMKFKQLLDAGAITQEEYDANKKQLLGL